MAVNLADLSKSGVRTESDVEQKLIMPLLTASEWLGIPTTDIQTKQYLPPTQIDKGAGRRIGYYPDYSIWISAVPIMIVEAKSPIESAEEGFREAQLYAHELNKVFPTGINPVQFVLCVNGRTLRCGYWDSTQITDLSVADLKLGTAAHHAIRSFIGYDALKREAATITQRFRPTQTYRPINFAGGEQALNRRIELNSFSIDIAPLVRMFFEPDSAERTEDIIQKGYVSSEEVTKYDQILETFLRDNVRSVQVPTAKEIATRQNQEGLLTPEIRSFQRRLPATGQVQLLIGPVGSGKSLFCQRYYNFLRPADLIESTFWSFLNFNDAPENLEGVENWVCKTFLESFEKEYPGFDLFSETNLRRIFAPDVNRLRKIYGRVVEADPAAFELRLANELATLTADVQRFAKSLCRFILGDQRKAVVTVFDNVDRRDREQQVKIFQVAQWFRSETRSFCLVSLRDETYEQFKRSASA